jgi:DNA-binding transcriptional MocR family regulator
MASPIMAEIVARLLHSGDLQRRVHLKRAAAARRNAIADRMLGTRLAPMSGTGGFHRWLPIPAGRTLIALVTQAAQFDRTSRRVAAGRPRHARHSPVPRTSGNG